jgi:hypothetical protein
MEAKCSFYSWLRHYATNRKAAGSIPMLLDFFNLPNPSSRTMILGSTQPLTEMSTRNLPGVKRGRRVRLKTLPSSVSRLCRENVGASMSHNLIGLQDLLQGYLTPFPLFKLRKNLVGPEIEPGPLDL